jgi:hypothetical protein
MDGGFEGRDGLMTPLLLLVSNYSFALLLLLVYILTHVSTVLLFSFIVFCP